MRRQFRADDQAQVQSARQLARYAVCPVFGSFQLIFEPSADFTSRQPTCNANKNRAEFRRPIYRDPNPSVGAGIEIDVHSDAGNGCRRTRRPTQIETARFHKPSLRRLARRAWSEPSTQNRPKWARMRGSIPAVSAKARLLSRARCEVNKTDLSEDDLATAYSVSMSLALNLIIRTSGGLKISRQKKPCRRTSQRSAVRAAATFETLEAAGSIAACVT